MVSRPEVCIGIIKIIGFGIAPGGTLESENTLVLDVGITRMLHTNYTQLQMPLFVLDSLRCMGRDHISPVKNGDQDTG